MEQRREELEEYRGKVLDELRLRVEKLKVVESALSSTTYLLAEGGASRALRAGNTLRVLVGAARAARLRRQREALLRQRLQAVEDVRRAEERLKEVDRELNECEQDGGLE